MVTSKYIKLLLLFVCFNTGILFCRDFIVEFDAGYAIPTNSLFRHAYKGNAIFGPECTIQFCDESKWYGFFSVDYFKTKGRDLRIADSTTLRLVPLGFGIKYFFPLHDRIDLYLGGGLQAVNIKKKTERACMVEKCSFWSVGAIGKLGAYFDIKCNVVLDLFFDYRFLRTKEMQFYGPTRCCEKANLSSAVFGIGLGYRFSL